MTFADTVCAKLNGLRHFVDDDGQSHYFETIESLHPIYAPGVVTIDSHVIVYKRWGQNYQVDVSNNQFKKYFGSVNVYGNSIDNAL